MKHRPGRILPVIILSLFACGSLWFSTNAILGDLVTEWSIGKNATGYITSAVQFGFIIGTLIFSWFTLSDRYSPAKIFCLCSFAGALANSLILIVPGKLITLVVLRFFTGFFLAGIYPIGMKIASGWYREGLGKALGFLVGALVLGTAFPHVLKATGYVLEWKVVLLTTSLLAVTGGLAMYVCVPDGPFIEKSTVFNGRALVTLFKIKGFRSAACGYFGHMWELYTFWAFLPFFLMAYAQQHPEAGFNVPLWAFLVIGSGSLGCVAGGIISRNVGSALVATTQLAISGVCCLLSPAFISLPPFLFVSVMLIWGITVAGDSPQYSAIIAHTTPGHLVGSALTLVNCIGFFITIISIQLLDMLIAYIEIENLLLFLFPGPLLGVYSMQFLKR
ncbi:MFS transporter [Desulfosediminicola flagellatus]|uniref:MFS transporter n=1 Tax=Desulfosediminicola flagellatus TaxID=2569541 RepID=UPI0010AD00BE|nr:MFS transporter [Desulfosediminicola flagellatus]